MQPARRACICACICNQLTVHVSAHAIATSLRASQPARIARAHKNQPACIARTHHNQPAHCESHCIPCITLYPVQRPHSASQRDD